MIIDKATLRASAIDWGNHPMEITGDDMQALLDEIDQLKAENEALRKLKLPHYLKLSGEMRAAGDHAELRAREDQCYSVPVLKAVFFEAAIQRWLDDQEEAIDAAMAKEASNG